jgi:hypothetical protein
MSVESTPSTVFPASEIRWAEDLAARVRLVLASCADDTTTNRQSYLEEEIRRGLEAVPSGQRERYLDALAEKFPTWQQSPSTTEAVSAAMREPGTFDEWMQALVRAAPRWSVEEKRKLRDRLVELGMVDSASGPGIGESFGEVKHRMGLAANEAVVPVRLAKLCAAEADFLTKLEQLVWNTWRELAPRTALKRDAVAADFRALLRRYLRGDAEPSDAQVVQQVERTRQLIAVMLSSVSQVSRGFVKRYQTRYSPDAIQDLVKLAGRGGWLTNRDALCWQKYVELAAEISDASVRADMQEVVVKYVEDVMRGMPRGGA